MSECMVCGFECGPLKGQAKSWRCAGLLAHSRRDGNALAARDTLRAKFANDHKVAARRVLEADIMALPSGGSVLDLYGGGLSAEWIRSLRPDVRLVVAERDRKLWRALRLDAQRVGFTPVAGDFGLAEPFGPFDLIWLDLCGDILTAYEAVSRVQALLPSRIRSSFWYGSAQEHPSARPCVVYLTSMSASRRGFAELSREFRQTTGAALLGQATGAYGAEIVHTYPQAGGKGTADVWRIGPSYVDQLDAIAESQVRRREVLETHRDYVAVYWRTWKPGYSDDSIEGRSHAAGSCRCECVRVEEREANSARYKEAHRAALVTA